MDDFVDWVTREFVDDLITGNSDKLDDLLLQAWEEGKLNFPVIGSQISKELLAKIIDLGGAIWDVASQSYKLTKQGYRIIESLRGRTPSYERKAAPESVGVAREETSGSAGPDPHIYDPYRDPSNGYYDSIVWPTGSTPNIPGSGWSGYSDAAWHQAPQRLSTAGPGYTTWIYYSELYFDQYYSSVDTTFPGPAGKPKASDADPASLIRKRRRRRKKVPRPVGLQLVDQPAPGVDWAYWRSRAAY
jgi:hypothetical protein